MTSSRPIRTLYVDLLICDMNGVVRGKRIERASLHKVYEKGINLPASLFALDINGSTVESTGLGLDIGDADRSASRSPTPCGRAVAEAPDRAAADDHARTGRRAVLRRPA
jgi:glutamine synthetase